MRLLQHLLLVLLLIASTTAFAGGGQQTGDASARKEREKIAQLKKSYEKAKATHVARPRDEKARKTFVDSATLYARTVMFAPSLAPKEKYPEALRVYREVLKADPKNREAKDSIQTIESIYASMGRPIPK